MIPNHEAIVEQLQTQLPGLLAIYAFGSRIQGNANVASDLDLAVLVKEKLGSEQSLLFPSTPLRERC